MKNWLLKLGAVAALACFLMGLVSRGQGRSATVFTAVGGVLLVGTLLLIFRSGGDED